MKKNMLIAILIATFFSCTEVLDELNTIGIDPSVIADSLNAGKKDSVIVEEDSVIIEDSSIVEEEQPPFTSDKLGTSITKQELEIWKERTTSGQFSENWARIVKNANAFLVSPQAEIWKHNLRPIIQTKPETNPPHAVKPVREGIKLRDAAFYYLLTGSATHGNKAKEILLKQTREPSVDFSDRGIWTLEIGSQPPMFHVAEWVTTLLHTYEYIKPLYSAAEQKEIKKWFHNAGIFFDENVSRELDRLFVDRKNGNYTLSGYSKAVTEKNVNKNMSTHIGGHKIHALAAWNYQNRQASQVRTVAEVGFLVGDEALKSSAHRTVKEFVAFWIFPSGLTNEFHRGIANYPEAGFYYSFMQVEILLSIADLFARNGDTSLYDYKTSKGWFGTEGGEKSLWLVARTLCQLKNGEYYDKLTNSNKLYVVKKDPYYLIDGREQNNYFTKSPLIYVQEIYLAQYNIYFNDQYVKDTYMKALNTTTRISSAGPHHYDQGVWGVCPSKRMMFWDLEGKIWPYNSVSN